MNPHTHTNRGVGKGDGWVGKGVLEGSCHSAGRCYKRRVAPPAEARMTAMSFWWTPSSVAGSLWDDCSTATLGTVNVSLRFEWLTMISQSASADETHYSFGQQHYRPVRIFFFPGELSFTKSQVGHIWKREYFFFSSADIFTVGALSLRRVNVLINFFCFCCCWFVK